MISDVPTNQNVAIKAAKGYNNGVYLINEICREQYSNSNLGVEARNLNLLDIEPQFSTEGINIMFETEYKKRESYPVNKQYPSLYPKEFGSGIDEEPRIDGIDKNEDGVTEEELTKEPVSNQAKTQLWVTNTYYSFSEVLPLHFEDCKDGNSNFRDVIFEKGREFWISSRFAAAYSANAGFGLFYASGFSIDGSNLFYSAGDGYSYQHYLRPVVSLGNNIQVVLSDNEPNGTDTEHMHQIIEK